MSTLLCKRLSIQYAKDTEPTLLINLFPLLVGKYVKYNDQNLQILNYKIDKTSITLVTKLGIAPIGYTNSYGFIFNKRLYLGSNLSYPMYWRFEP